VKRLDWILSIILTVLIVAGTAYTIWVWAVVIPALTR